MIDIDIFEEPENQRVLADDNVLKKMIFSHIRLQGHTGVHHDVKGWSPKIDMDISEEPENQRVPEDNKVPKKYFLSKVLSTWLCRGAF